MVRCVRPLDPRALSGTLTLSSQSGRMTHGRHAVPGGSGSVVQGHLLHTPLNCRCCGRLVPGRPGIVWCGRVRGEAVRVGRDVRLCFGQRSAFGGGRESSLGLGSRLRHVRGDIVELEIVRNVMLGGDASAEPLSRMRGRVVSCTLHVGSRSGQDGTDGMLESGVRR